MYSKNKTIKSRLRKILCLILTAALLSPVMFSSVSDAKSQDELKKQKQEIEKKETDAKSRRNDASQNLNNLKNEAGHIQSNVNGIENNINNVRAEINDTRSKVVNASRDIDKLQEDLENAKAKQKEQYEAMKNQIVLSYENGHEQSFFTASLESGSIADFINRAQYIYSIHKYNEKMISSLEKLQKTIEEKTDALKTRQGDLTRYSDTLSSKQGELENLLASENDKLSDKNKEVIAASTDVDEIDREISGYKASVQAIDAQVAAAQAAAAQRAAAEMEAEKAAAEAELTKKNQELEEAKKTLDDAKNTGDQTKIDEAAKNVDDKQNDVNHAEENLENVSKISSSQGQVYENSSELNLLEAIVTAEAGNQGYAGKLAVASVILNRVFCKKYGFGNVNTISAVVYQKNQFEPVTRHQWVKVNGTWQDSGMTVLEYYLAHPELINQETVNACKAAMSGQRYQGPGGPMNQLFFMTPDAFSRQSWLKNRTIADKFTLKGHTFFNVL